MPCFRTPETLMKEIRMRLDTSYLQSAYWNLSGEKPSSPGPTQNDFLELADRLIKSSANSFYTDKYDSYQQLMLGIFK